MKKILITGGAGFIGSHTADVSEWLYRHVLDNLLPKCTGLGKKSLIT